MKHTKLLKSAVLSTALLWGGATHAQSTTGDMGVTIAAAGITITAGNLSFGAHTGVTTSQVVLACATAGDTTTGANKVTDGNCADITLSASKGTLSYGVGVISKPLISSAGTSIPGRPILTLYEGSDGTTAVPFDTRSITSGTDVSYVLGGTYDIPANTPTGTYSADFIVQVVIL